MHLKSELHREELLDAFKSRVQTLNYDPSDAQLGALMFHLAENNLEIGSRRISPDEAVQVAEYLIGEILRLGCRFDLRLFLNKALPDHQQWKDGETESDWRDLVTASIEEHLVAVRFATPGFSREQHKQADRSVLQEILKEFDTREARLQAWQERTGKSERAYYRRSAELK